MNNAERILIDLDHRLNSAVDLTLYGRAALSLGFDSAPAEFGQSMDVDIVLALGQAETLLKFSNFWKALDESNQALADSGLYISHLFVEDQVILTATWRQNRRPINGRWSHLQLYRLGDEDLLLSKLMRDDPHDRADALFIVRRANFGVPKLNELFRRAVIPPSPEIESQFQAASTSLLNTITQGTE